MAGDIGGVETRDAVEPLEHTGQLVGPSSQTAMPGLGSLVNPILEYAVLQGRKTGEVSAAASISWKLLN